jgi:hypothetical protein
MLFWRNFLIIFGMIFGAVFGLDIAVFMRWLDGLLIAVLGGVLLGGACGWTFSHLIPKAIEKLKQTFPPDARRLPPPRHVLRLGSSLGFAEGVVVGVVYSGIIAAIVGGYIGMIWGSITADLSWRIRRNIPLVLLALILGFLVEVGGCLVIVHLVKTLANDFLIMCMTCVLFSGVLLLRFLRQYREFRSTGQHKSFEPHETGITE